jgi:hypothetical protein
MVKGFDPTKTDPTKLFLDYLFSTFDSKLLSCATAAQLITSWLQNSELTSWVYR